MLYSYSYTEKELLLEVAAGNEQAFRVLFEKYHHLLGAHIFRIIRSHELAEEITQDIFLKLWMSRETLAEIRDIKAYLFTISRNAALNSLKSIARERNVFAKTDWERLETSISLEAEEPNYYGLLDEAIDALPPQQQKVYILSRREHMKYSDISKQLSLSKETVKKYLQLATESITKYILQKISIDLLLLCTFFL